MIGITTGLARADRISESQSAEHQVNFHSTYAEFIFKFFSVLHVDASGEKRKLLIMLRPDKNQTVS